jgi:hypothetical protein
MMGLSEIFVRLWREEFIDQELAAAVSSYVMVFHGMFSGATLVLLLMSFVAQAWLVSFAVVLLYLISMLVVYSIDKSLERRLLPLFK